MGNHPSTDNVPRSQSFGCIKRKTKKHADDDDDGDEHACEQQQVRSSYFYYYLLLSVTCSPTSYNSFSFLTDVAMVDTH
jgi:hypothetical protein